MKIGLWIAALFTTSVYAYVPAYQPQGVGKVADNLLQPVAFASQFIYSACLVIGASFIFAGIIKYVEHRRNPLVAPMSTVVFLFLAGIFLMALPFAYLLSNNQSPYDLFK